MVIISFDVVLLFAIEKLDTKRHYRGKGEEEKYVKNAKSLQKTFSTNLQFTLSSRKSSELKQERATATSECC